MSPSSIPFSLRPLERRFVGAKPIESAPAELLTELEEAGRLIKQRKRNGYGVYVPVTQEVDHEVELYTRGIASLSRNFPQLCEEVRALNIPPDTLLAGELLAEEKGVDSTELLTRYVKSRPAISVALQHECSIPPALSFFNVIVHKGRDVSGLAYEDRLDLLRELLHTAPASGSIGLVEVLDEPLAAAQARSIAAKWEGLVLYDAAATTTYRLDGNRDQPPRPHGCWKWKDYQEGDFVAYGWRPSSAASRTGMVKDLLIGQYDPRTGALVEWGKCGVGLSIKQCAELANDSLYPLVFEIKFERRTPKQRLIGARILRQRIDKAPRECLMPPEYCAVPA